MTDDEIIAYALAHAVATLDFPADADEHQCGELMHQYGQSIGVDVPLGDEYQRAVLHRFDPERVPDFPLPDAEEHRRAFEGVHGAGSAALDRDQPERSEGLNATAVLFTLSTLAEAFEQSGERAWSGGDVAAVVRRAQKTLECTSGAKS